MDKPLHRVLSALELLQSQPSISGAELAERLAVDRRTVRRYIVALEALGVPIRAERGRDGHYALMPGYKLPPLMFTADETLALAVGLRVARELGLSGMAPAVASAQAKIDRVMPKKLTRRAGDLNAVVSLDFSGGAESGSAHFQVIAQCAGAAQRVALTYRATGGAVSEREFNPYGLGFRAGSWYAVGYCHARKALRSFRLDRVLAAEPLPRTFAMPRGFDVMKYLADSIAGMARAHEVVVRFDGDFAQVRRQVPGYLGRLTEDERGVWLHAQADELDWMARELSRVGVPFEVVAPKGLKGALRAHLRGMLGRVGKA